MSAPLEFEYEGKIIHYEENFSFNERIDYDHGPENGYIPIAGVLLRPSEILFRVDPHAYINALTEYTQNELEAVKENIFSKYPTPIAFTFERFERVYESQLQRFFLLKDTWESIIFLLYALILGEFRHRKIPLNGTDIKPKQIVSESLFDRLSICEQLIKLAINKEYDLICLKFVSPRIIESLADLNRVRNNNLAHEFTKSDTQCRQLVEEYEPLVVSILQDMKEIENIVLLRYVSQEGLVIRYEDFRGCSLNRTLANRDVKPHVFQRIHPYLNNQYVLAAWEDNIFCISPFVHFKVDESGNHPRLCFYKKKKGAGPNIKFFYEVLDGSGESELEEVYLSRSNFTEAIDEINELLPDLSRGGGISRE